MGIREYRVYMGSIEYLVSGLYGNKRTHIYHIGFICGVIAYITYHMGGIEYHVGVIWG